MADNTYYRPLWTCGRYNSKAQVALMYNLIEGKSFFFESYSANVIAEILSTKRNEVIDINAISAKTVIAFRTMSTQINISHFGISPLF